jgi:7-carboxy-7-deazaguanine synthase
VDETLEISEIFLSIQGEGTRAGRPCAFIRLAGCNLSCTWCDTSYARQAAYTITVEEAVGQANRLGCPLVEVTGGEPLAQPGGPALLTALADEGFETLLETNGSLDISAVDERVVRIVDFKCPSSGQAEGNLWSNVQHLKAADEVKFVIADWRDFGYATRVVCEHELSDICTVIYQPVTGRLTPATLADWILKDQLNVRLGLQLHKIVWPGVEKGV